ncbi:HutD/Ves family protein [Bordetella genomosp. 8]|uniref:HutD/Ves family protein n=1 Tax=Bordetella genomosp. 8 TaxID=1416806 RepID=UPI001E443351|nr:HutD family protein [Bordetella genomosp. 8]
MHSPIVSNADIDPVPFRLADVPAQPWKNGGGLTREIVCWPPGAGMEDFLWRISVARIDAGGPFSSFAGVDRIITLLSGAGVVLRGGFKAGEHDLTTPLAPFAFPGDVAVDCTLQGGASEDFNVMSRRGTVQADVQVIGSHAIVPSAASGLLLAVGSCWEVERDDGSQHVLEPDEGLWWARQPYAWRVRCTRKQAPVDTGLIVVSIDMPAPRDATVQQEAT